MAVSIVHTANVQVNAPSALTVALGAASTNGNTLLVGIELFSQVSGSTTPDVTAVSDGGHNTFTRAASSDAPNTSAVHYGLRTIFYYATGIVGQTTPTVTVTTDTDAYSRLTLWELSPSVFDQATGGSGNGSGGAPANTNIDAGTLTPSQNESANLYLSVIDYDGTQGWTMGAWTANHNSAAGNGTTLSAYQLQGVASPLAFSIPFSGNGTTLAYAASGIVFVSDPAVPLSIIEVVQAHYEEGGSGSPYSLPFPTRAGNTIAIGVEMFGQAGGSVVPQITGISDGRHTLIEAPATDVQKPAGSYGLHTRWYYVEDCLTGTETITVTTDIGVYFRTVMLELSPCSFDDGNGASATVLTPADFTAGAITPTASGGVAATMVLQDGAGAPGWLPDASTWTVLAATTAGGGGTYAAYAPLADAAPIDMGVDFASEGTINYAASGIVFVPPQVGITQAITQAAESDSALAFTVTRLLRVAITAVGESETATALAAHKLKAISAAREIDTAYAFPLASAHRGSSALDVAKRYDAHLSANAIAGATVEIDA